MQQQPLSVSLHLQNLVNAAVDVNQLYATESKALSYHLSVSTGCQVCGREEETAAGIPSHGDEQTDPDTAGVHSSPDQRGPAVSAAFLSVSACSI